MTYERYKTGFQNFRILPNVGGTAPRMFAPGTQLDGTTALALDVTARPVVLDQLVVALPQSTAPLNEVVEIYDIRAFVFAGFPQAGITPIVTLRPWGPATMGSYSIPLHLELLNGLIVRVGHADGSDDMEEAEINVMWGPLGRNPYIQDR